MMNPTSLVIPAIIFDFGGVLLDWDPRYLYRKIFNGDESAMERFLADIDFYNWNLLQDAGRPFSEGIAACCLQFPQYCDLIEVYNTRWEESIKGPIAGSIEVLTELKNKGFALFGLTNWSDEKFSLVRHRYPFFNWFEKIIISGAVKLAKPDPRIFELTLTEIGRPPEECLLIDDSVTNIEVARSLGFQTIRFRDSGLLRQELAQFEWWRNGTR